MAKNKVGDWDTIAANNTDVGGIDIDENSPGGNLDNALREIMAQVAALDPVGGGRLFETVFGLVADTCMGYDAGDAVPVSGGDIVVTREGPFTYSIAASTATDHHVTTSGGVKLYVQPGESYRLAAFGCTPGGTIDDTGRIQMAINAAGADGVPLSGGGNSYRFDGALTDGHGIVLQDVTLSHYGAGTAFTQYSGNDTYQQEISISNVTLDGANSSATTGWHSIKGLRGSFSNFRVVNFAASNAVGAVLEGTTS